MRFFFTVVLSVATASVSAQCLTDFTKLLPEPSIDYTLGFGSSISMYGDYLAVGIPNSDSLGRITGIVQIYRKDAAEHWAKVASMAPSNPVDALQFGFTVKMSANYLLVGASGGGGKVYVFKKPVSGWTSQTELTAFKVIGSTYFGIAPYSVSTNPVIDISADEQTVAIADQAFVHPIAPTKRSGAIFVYHRQAGQEWTGTLAPTVILSPEDDTKDFGRAGVSLHGDRLLTGTPFAPTANGKLYIYRDATGTFSNFQLEAGLTSGGLTETTFMGFYNAVLTEDGVFASATFDLTGSAVFGIIYFQIPASGIWSNATPTCFIDPDGAGTANQTPLRISAQPGELYVSSRDKTGDGFFTRLTKGTFGWCEPQRERVDEYHVTTSSGANSYSAVVASSHTGNAVVGFVSHPDQPTAKLALQVLSKTAAGTWKRQLLYPTKGSTAGHRFGTVMMGFDDYLFVGAPKDGTRKAGGGAVYAYRKSGSNWQKISKIVPQITDVTYDDAFGTALAHHGDYLAVGAAGFGAHGRIFMYKQRNDWKDVDLVQEIDLPSTLTVYAFGDNIAMTDSWLAIPYVQNAPARVMLAMYKFNGAQWSYSQVIEITMASVLSKGPSLAVAIEGNTLVIAGKVLELNTTSNQWQMIASLSPSDPEPMQISSDFSHWITDGSMFGYSVAISDNTIFVGAPTKDYNGVWNVGAVYVYTKLPGESWTSRKESTKILPRVKDEMELFGYSVQALHNTLIAGAPGNDYFRNNAARNKPGRAYVFQAADYHWKDVTPLIDFTGDTFLKDYFGMSVYLDETDFFIGASLEDIDNARLSGSVYITPTPPLVRLVPPVCSSLEVVTLWGYPFGGTWSGKGIIDPVAGTFDPTVAGPGIHQFLYETPSCTYTGRLKIEVVTPAPAVILGNPLQEVCSNASINITLRVQPQTDATYSWYMRTDATRPFVLLSGETQASYRALQRGEYQAKVNTRVCQEHSDIITIRNEQVEVTVETVEICKGAGTVALTGTPAGGTWSGSGVTNNTFSPANLTAGSTYTLKYTYQSPLGCPYSQTTSALVSMPPAPTIQRLNGDLCVDGTVSLTVPGMPSGTIYTWMKGDERGTAFSPVAGDQSTLAVAENGVYKVEANVQGCVGLSPAVHVNDRIVLALLPGDSEVSTCDDRYVYSLNASPGSTTSWYFSENGQDAGNPLTTGNTLTASKSGYYRATVQQGVCAWESQTMHLTILPQDSVFIPNVFTPNGDGKNDLFVPYSASGEIHIKVVNRYGTMIFSGNQSNGWAGDDAPSGVYFWYASYRVCDGQWKNLKGFVHMLR